jgi:hypothetical protein
MLTPAASGSARRFHICHRQHVESGMPIDWAGYDSIRSERPSAQAVVLYALRGSLYAGCKRMLEWMPLI